MWKTLPDGTKKIRWGKLFVFILLSVFSIVGLVLVFVNPGAVDPLCQLIEKVTPAFLILVGGVAGSGIAEKLVAVWVKLKGGGS